MFDHEFLCLLQILFFTNHLLRTFKICLNICFKWSMSLWNNLFVVVFLGIGDHGLCSRLPVGRADFSVSINELEGLDKSQVLIGISANGKIVNRWVSDDSVSVNDVGGSVWNTDVSSIFTKASVGFWDFFVEIWDKRNIHRSKSSFFSLFNSIFHMWEFGVNWDSNNFTSDFMEFFSLVIEGNYFGWTDKGEVKRVEEKNDVFAVIGLDVNVDEVVLEPCGGIEVRSWFSDERHILTLIWLKMVRLMSFII